jgi:hypothetical protein
MIFVIFSILCFGYLLNILLSLKPDWATFWVRRPHHLANGVKNRFELSIVFFFQSVEFAGELGVRGKKLAEADKGPHNFDIYPDGLFTL